MCICELHEVILISSLQSKIVKVHFLVSYFLFVYIARYLLCFCHSSNLGRKSAVFTGILQECILVIKYYSFQPLYCLEK